MRAAEQTYEKHWSHCRSCGCFRPLRELEALHSDDDTERIVYMCRDTDWCTTHRQREAKHDEQVRA